MRYKEVSAKMLHQALAKLDEFTGWKDPKDIHRFNKFKNTFDREHKKAGYWYNKLVQKHAELEPVKRKNPKTNEMEEVKEKDGKTKMKPKWGPNGNGQMDIIFKNYDAFEKDVQVFHDHTFTVKVYKFKVDDFVTAGLTPVELRACVRIAEDMDPDLLIDEDELDVEGEDMPEDLSAILAEETPQESSDGTTDTPAPE
jgi:hypothetical protein